MKMSFIFIFLMSIMTVAAVPSAFANTSNEDNSTKSNIMECREDLILFIKEDGSHLCINEESAYILVLRDWLFVQFSNITTTIKNNEWHSQAAEIDIFDSIASTTKSLKSNMEMASMMMSESDMFDEGIGLAVGGAQDINNFRENIKAGYLPIPTDITPEGLFYDYHFDTGQVKECNKLFCPSYVSTISPNPFTNNDEYWLSVGLNSGIKQSDFERSDLNLVIVLDVSGSMSSQLDNYYYDNPSSRPSFDSSTKMEAANKAVAGLTDHLGPNDKLGIVLFDDDAHLARPLSSMNGVDRNQLKENIMQIYPDGGTHMEKGMKIATSMLTGNMECGADLSCVLDGDLGHHYDDQRESRIIFLTDAMPNIGDISKDSLLGMVNDNANIGIYTTFIGIGLDFNTELIDAISKVQGANYYSVHTPDEFDKRMIEEFDFMVTPLVFDLKLTIESDGWMIDKIYGSPEANSSTGELLKVNTLFPSNRTDGETRGGIILIKLAKTGSITDEIILSTSYSDRNGTKDGDIATFMVTNDDNSGIDKGILLARYAHIMEAWVVDERAKLGGFEKLTISDMDDFDFSHMVSDYSQLGIWERTSVDLIVSDDWKLLITEFKMHFENEMTDINDQNLEREVELMKILESWSNNIIHDNFDK